MILQTRGGDEEDNKWKEGEHLYLKRTFSAHFRHCHIQTKWGRGIKDTLQASKCFISWIGELTENMEQEIEGKLCNESKERCLNILLK